MIYRTHKNLLISCLLVLTHPCYAEVSSTNATQAVNQAEITNDSIEESRARAQNPLSPHYSIPLKYVYHGSAPRGDVSILSLQPIFPIALGQKWNLINQMNLNFADTDGGITGVPEIPSPYVKKPALGPQGATGLADLNFTSLLSPTKQRDIYWGVGTSITFPTDAPSRELGSGKFSIGPAATLLKQTESWTVGMQTSQIWSVLGSSARASISQLQLKPIVNYNLSDGWYLLSNMTVVSNWHTQSDQQWTVPIGAGIGKVFDLGEHKLNTRLESYYNIVRPDQAPDWSVGMTVQVMLPK
jgi:hypothetical protein